MTAVVVSISALCVLFVVDICVQIFTTKATHKVVKYRERRYERQSLQPMCVFVDFECPVCGESQHTVIEYKTEPKILPSVRRKIRHCPMCGCRLYWV